MQAHTPCVLFLQAIMGNVTARNANASIVVRPPRSVAHASQSFPDLSHPPSSPCAHLPLQANAWPSQRDIQDYLLLHPDSVLAAVHFIFDDPVDRTALSGFLLQTNTTVRAGSLPRPPFRETLQSHPCAELPFMRPSPLPSQRSSAAKQTLESRHARRSGPMRRPQLRAPLSRQQPAGPASFVLLLLTFVFPRPTHASTR